MIEQIAFKILFLYSLVFGVQHGIPAINGDWTTEAGWVRSEKGYSLQLESRSLPELCRLNPAGEVVFPMSYYSVQELRGDGHLLSFHNLLDDTETVFSSLNVACFQIASYEQVSFTVVSPSFYFARIFHAPYVAPQKSLQAVYSRMSYVLGFSIMVALLVFGYVAFRKKLDTSYFLIFLAACMAMAIFCFVCTPGYWGIKMSLQAAHKAIVASLSLSAYCILLLLYKINLLSRLLLRTTAVLSLIALFMIMQSQSIDVAQSAINICYVTYFVSVAYAAYLAVRIFIKKRTAENLLILLSIVATLVASSNDCLCLVGAIDSVMVFPLGLATLFVAQGFFMHRQFQVVYDERDQFRQDLEVAYQEKLAMVQKNAIAHTIANTTQMIAHDMKKPFSMLQLLLDQIDRASANPQLHAHFRRCLRESSQYVDSLLADLLVAGRERANRLEPIDLAELVHTIWQQQMVGLERQVDLELQLDCGQLFVDRTKVTRLFTNLLANALEALPQDAGRVWVRAHDVEEEGRAYAEITVGNADSYVPAELKELLFTKFHPSDKHQGTGLGLAICQDIVHSHGGQIRCESEQNSGTELIFTLPVLRAPS